MTKKTNKALAVLLALVMVISLLPVSALASYSGNLTIDYKDVENESNSATPPTLEEGQVWTGKHVSSASDADDKFGIQLSALGQNYTSTTPGSSTLANVVLVLDVSGSTQDNNKLVNMVSAVNTAVSSILAANPANKVGVVTFSTGSSTLVTLRSTSFDLTTNKNSQDGDTFYVHGDGGTNIQSGINRGYGLLKAARDVHDTATPIMIVLSDGVACYYNASYTSIPTGSYGSSGWQQDGHGYLNVSDGVSSNDGITAAAYTIVQAMYLKDQMPDLRIYTIGYGTGANRLANATLNPTEANIASVTGAGSSPKTLTSQLTATGYSASDGYFYPEEGGTFSGTSVDLPTLIATFNSILSAILNNNAPLAEGTDLMITDTISDDFVLSEGLTVNLAGTQYILTDGDSDGTYTSADAALNGLSVEISGTTLTWTIPKELLPCNSYQKSGDSLVVVPASPITLNFNVELNGTSAADTMYYTNYSGETAYNNRNTTAGAGASFTPAAANPYYVVSQASETVTTGGPDTYTNIAAVPGHWETTGDVASTDYRYWASNFTSSEDSLSFSYVDIGHGANYVRYEQDADDSDGETTFITCEKPNGGYKNHWCKVVVTRTHAVEGEDKTVTVISFWLYPNGGTQTENSNMSGYSQATRTITTYAWVAPVAEQTAFTVTPDPTANGDVITIEAGGNTYSDAIVTSFADATHWTAEKTTTSGNVTTVYTFTRSGDTLTVSYVETTSTDAVYKNGCVGGVASIAMKSTGKIRLCCATASLRIDKDVAAYDGTNKGGVTEFTFSVSVAGFTGTATIYNASGVQQGTAAITSGSGSIQLEDGWYAVIGGIPVGTDYSVTEDDYSGDGYVTATAGDTSGTIASLGNYVTFTNTYYPTAHISITKSIDTLYDSVTVPNGLTFPFALYSYDGTNYTKLPAFGASVNTDDEDLTTTMDIRMDQIASLFGENNSVTLYVHEETMEGSSTYWTQDAHYYPVTITKAGVVTYGSGSTVTVTNTYVPTSQLTLTKSISGGDPAKEFTFSVALGGTGNYTCSLYKNGALVDVNGDGTVDSGDTLHDNSTVSVALKSDDNIVITGLPVGTPYEITENNYVTQGYVSSLTGNTTTGSVSAGAEGSSVSVINTHRTNDLTVSKSVDGPAPSTDTFTFTVKMNGAAFPGTFSYVYSDDAEGTPLHTSSNGTFTLKGGQSATLKGIPAGATYTVTETANDAYTTSSGTAPESLTANDNDVAVLLPTTGTTTVYFQNAYKTGQLTVTKSVLVDAASPASSESYPITVTFANGYLGGIKYNNVNNASGVYEITLANGSSALFTGIPAGVTYTVEETDSKGADDVSYVFSDIYKTISDTDADSVTITNSYLTPATLTISKDVLTTLDSAGVPSSFPYSIYFYKMVEVPAVEPSEENPEGIPAYSEPVGYVLADDELPSEDEPVLVEGTEAGHYTFSLEDEQSIAFNNLPVGLLFEVQETDDGDANESYATVNTTGAAYAAVDENDDLLVAGEIPQDTDHSKSIVVKFTNDFQVTPGSLTITKHVTDPTGLVQGTYTFQVIFTGQTEGITPTLPSGVSVADNDPVIDETNHTVTYTLTATVNAGGNVSIGFSGLRAGTAYSVTETGTGGADSTKVNGSTGTSASASGIMAKQVDDAFAVQNVPLTFENIYDPPTTTTVKTVDHNKIYVDGTVTYTVVVTNTGEDTVTLDAVEDPMLAGAANILLDGSNTGFTLDTTTGDGTVTPRLVIGTELAAGASVTITYSVTFGTAGTKDNTAYSVAHRGDYPVYSEGSATVTVIPHSEISVKKYVKNAGDFSDTSVTADYMDTLTYKAVITNSGVATLTGIELNDSYFSQTTTTVVGATLNDTALTKDTDYFVDTTNSKITFSSGFQLAAGDVLVVIYTSPATAGPSADYTATNTASVKGFDGIQYKDDSDTASYTVNIPTISVDKTASATSAYTNESVTYTVEITNGYDLPMDLISINDTMFVDADGDGIIDSGAYNIAAKDNDGNPLTLGALDTTTGTLSFNTGTAETPIYPSVAKDEKVTLTYTVDFAEAGSYNNMATATMSYRGLTATANDTETVRIADPEIGIVVTKLVNGQPSVTVSSGSTVTYTATIENTSDVDLCHVYFADAAFKDSSFQLISVVDGNTADLTGYTFETLEDGTRVLTFGYQDVFEKGATITVTYTLRLTASYINEVTGFAFFNSKESWINVKDTATVTIRRDDDPGDPTYYTVTVNYLDQDTGDSIEDPYTTSGTARSHYDVTRQILDQIGDYELVSRTGDAATGTLNGDKVINLYYVAPEEDIPDESDVPGGETPEIPDEGVVVIDDDTPQGNLPQTGTVAEPAKHVWTLGMLAISLSMAAAGLHITFSRKKKEDEE